MKCEHPLATHGMLHGCGQCMPCRINRQRIWTHRLELEATQYRDDELVFLTLTYDDKNLPDDYSLDKVHAQRFIKRLRYYYSPRKFRHFTVGEYGDRTERPHYHSLLFGYPGCDKHRTEYTKGGEIKCCNVCKEVRLIWGKGFVYLGRVEPTSISYTCGYVTKKMTNSIDPRLNGRRPEFSMMSLKPGIGKTAMENLASQLPETLKDTVISSLSYDKSIRPLGRYLTRTLNVSRGLSPDHHVQNAANKLQAEVFPLRLAARADEQNPSLTSHYKIQNEGKYASQKAKLAIFKKGRSL